MSHRGQQLVIAYLLWFFLGVFGIHRFYLGRYITGTLYLLTGAFLGIGWILDIVLTVMICEENWREQDSYI